MDTSNKIPLPSVKVKMKTIKHKIDKFIKNENNLNILFDACNRCNKLVIYTYQFLRLFILSKYYNKTCNIPKLTKEIIKKAMMVLVQNNNIGAKTKGKNKDIQVEFNNFYNSVFCKLNNYDKIDGLNLSNIIDILAGDILKNIENNIKLNYINHIKCFVNRSFQFINKEEINKSTNKKEKTKEIKNDMIEIKNDIFNNTLLSNIKYHNWINKHKDNIIKNHEKLEEDVQINPQQYLKYMIYMCLELEKINIELEQKQPKNKYTIKLFQFFPLRNNIYPKYMPLSTSCLVDLFPFDKINKTNKILLNDLFPLDKPKNNDYYTKTELMQNITKFQKYIWNEIFNLDLLLIDVKKDNINNIKKCDNKNYRNKYSFNYTIYTNCFDVSFNLLRNEYIQIKEKRIINNKKSIKNNNLLRKNMNEEEKINFKDEIIKNNEYKKECKIKQNNEEIKKKKEEFKSKPKIEQINIAKSFNQFKYLDDLEDEEIFKLKKSNWVVVDPGKNTLLQMKNKRGRTFRYTNKNYLFDTKRFKYLKLLQRYKNKCKISKIENELSNYNSKTCNYKKFKEFIFYKNKINNLLFDEYKAEIFRKYNWYSFLNKKKAEVNLIKKIKFHFGKKAIICFGDWSRGKQMKGIVSTPNLRLKKLIAKHFKVYELDEFKTSQINCYTGNKNDNLWLPDKKNKLRELHSVLTYQMDNKRLGCINRDVNAVNNMIYLVKYFIKYKSRPTIFTRDKKITAKKPTNSRLTPLSSSDTPSS
jgi:hypothetical protein